MREVMDKNPDKNEGGIPQCINDRPDIKFLNRYVREQLCAKGPQAWKDLGIELLGVESSDALDVLKSNHSDVTNYCLAMFQLWIERQPTATWRQLIQALKQLQFNYLADQIESKLIIPALEASAGQILCHCDSQRKQPITNNQLMAEFSHLLVRIRRILSQSPNQKNNLEACKELCCYLKVSGNANIPLFNTEKKSEIDNCRNFKELFDIVSQHLSWMEHSPLDEIIDECDSIDAVKEFNQYKKKLGACQALEIIGSAESDPPKGFERVCVVINQPYKRLTFEDYEKIKSFIFTNLDVYRYVTTGYIRVLFDSLHLEWHVIMQAIPHMIKMAHKQQALFTKKSYVFMQIGKEIIINMHTEQPLVNLPQIMAVTVKENTEIVPHLSSDNEPCFDFDCKKYKLQTTYIEHPEHGNDGVVDDATINPASSCAYCDKEDPVVAYCNTCTSSLCTFCYDCHVRQKQYKSHDITNFDNVATTMVEEEITECPDRDNMPSNISAECAQTQEPDHLLMWEINRMEKELSKTHGKIEDTGKILAMQTEMECAKLDQFYTEVMHNAQQRREENLKQLHDKALELENISLAQLKDIESVQNQLECLKRCLNKPDTTQVLKELSEKYEAIMAQPIMTSVLQFLSPDIQTLHLGEVVCTSSESNDIQKDDDSVFHDHNPQPAKRRICIGPRSHSFFKLPTIKGKLKRNKSDSSIKRLKKVTMSNSKDRPLYHINHIKFPKWIKTNGGTMGRMFGIGINKNGTWATADYNNHCVHVCNAKNELVKILGNKGQGNGQFKYPVGVAFDNKNCLYVSEYGNHRVKKFDANFEYMLQFGEEGDDDGQLNHPMGIAAYKDKVYVADSANSRIAVFYTNGKFCCNIIGGCLRDPYDLAINKISGQLLVTDSASCVRIFTLDGTYINKFSAFGADKGQLYRPLSLAVDSNGFIFVADTYNHRISIFNDAGMFVRSFGSCGNNVEQFNRPQGIAFSPNGNLYISDYGNQRVMIFPTKFKLGQKHHYRLE